MSKLYQVSGFKKSILDFPWALARTLPEVRFDFAGAAVGWCGSLEAGLGGLTFS